MKKLIVLCAGLSVLLAVNGALADFTPIGEIVEGDSWTQQFYSEAAATDHFQMKMLSPAVLHAPTTFTWFGAAGWKEIYNDGQIAIAEGPRVVGPLYFNLTFNDLPSTFTFLLQGYDGTKLNAVDDNWIRWAPGWQIGVPSGWTPDPGRIVPVPAAVLLGMLGLSVAGLKLRKFA